MFDKKNLILEYKPLNEIRPVLSRFSTDFIKELQKRSAFKINEKLYIKNLFELSNNYFEYALEKKEKYYQAIGRFRHDSEFPITDTSDTDCFLPCLAAGPLRDPISEVKCDLSKLVPFYKSIIPKICKPGENVGYEGKIVDLDTDAIMSLSRRVNAGRYVAQDKYLHGESSRTIRSLLKNYYHKNSSQKIRQCLKQPEQEIKVLNGIENFVLNSAEITLDEKVIKNIFRDIIDYTLDLEVEFLVRNYVK